MAIDWICQVTKTSSNDHGLEMQFLLLDVTINRRFQSLAVTHSFPYSTFPVTGYYTAFTILDVSTEWHYLQFYSNIPLPDISITRRFSAPVRVCRLCPLPL